MTTNKQQRAIQNLVENGGNVSKAMVDAGYSESTAKTPKKLTDSKGYQLALDRAGLTSDLVLKALVEDIRSKPGDRLGELRLASKILSLGEQNTPDQFDVIAGVVVYVPRLGD